jgi:hypothetical protein
VRWVAFSSALDVVVPSDRSVPTFCPAEQVRVDHVGHLGMLRSQKVVDLIADILTVREPTQARTA